MRLIDADALLEVLNNASLKTEYDIFSGDLIRELIDTQPTIMLWIKL